MPVTRRLLEPCSLLLTAALLAACQAPLPAPEPPPPRPEPACPEPPAPLPPEADELRAVLEQGLNTPGTVVMDIIVHKETNVFPMIPGGAAHYEILLGPEDDEQKDAQPRELA